MLDKIDRASSNINCGLFAMLPVYRLIHRYCDINILSYLPKIVIKQSILYDTLILIRIVDDVHLMSMAAIDTNR